MAWEPLAPRDKMRLIPAQRSPSSGPQRPSPKLFDQRLPPERIVPHQQQNAKRCQVVWQFAIGTGIHIVDECGDRASEIASVEIIEGSLLTPLDIFVARNIGNNRTIHLLNPNLPDLFWTGPSKSIEMKRI